MRAIFPQAGDSSFFCLPRLYSTCGEQPFVIQKAKLLNMNSKLWLPLQVKVRRDSGKITIIWRNLIHTKLLEMTKGSLNGQRPSTLYLNVCIYSLISRLEYLKIFDRFGFSLKYKGFVQFSK